MMETSIENLHFLRPWWLLAAIGSIVVWWFCVRRTDPRESFKRQISPHLLDALVVEPHDRPRFRPTSLLLALWLIATVAVAGPSLRQQASPFAEDRAGLMLLVKMTPSMETEDLSPSRLERAGHKVHDLLQLRSGAKTGLIAYSASAHLVMPLTDDSGVIDHMMEALDPTVMPAEGDSLSDALSLASDRIAASNRPASILLITDGVEANQIPGLQDWRAENRESIQILAAVPDAATVSASGIEKAATVLAASTERVAADDADVKAINRRAENALVAAATDSGTRWQDDGYLLLPILLIGLAIWGRRGWSVS